MWYGEIKTDRHPTLSMTDRTYNCMDTERLKRLEQGQKKQTEQGSWVLNFV